jgi:membrane fusion protein (multidrug efflux system)
MTATKAQFRGADAPVDAPKYASRAPSRKAAIGALAAVVLAAGIYSGIRRWQFFMAHEETDDAQVEGHISPVLPRVPGYVSRVLVDDNARVQAGQALVEIDPRELDLRVSSADAALRDAQAEHATAQASLESARASAATAAANVQTALVRQRKAASDLGRDTRLSSTGAITDSQLSDTQAAADTAAAVLESVRREATASGAAVGVAAARVAAAQTRVAELAADLDLARLQRSYATIAAPIAGLVSRKSVEPGQYVQAGQTLMSIASESDVWVVANFKETQMAHVRPGQEVEFEADNYRGYVFRGRVESISGATGARFALLPPDNSTGNFVKVTQRVPVKIVLTQAPDADHPLRPGVSVDAVVRVGD